MATDLEKKANEAFLDDNLEQAVEFYSQAIVLDPVNANLYADRAQTNIKLNNFTEAVADTNKAIEFDPSMAKAYLRKGNACIKLEEYQTAKTALEAGLALAPGDSRFTKLIKECEDRIAEETGDLPKKITEVSSSKSMSEVTNATHDVQIQSREATNKPKYRHDYYNSSTDVVLTIFAKGVAADYVSIHFGEQILSVVVDIPGEENYQFQPRLFGKIIPEECKYQVLATKIEIRLRKAEPITWSSLEYSNKQAVIMQKTTQMSEVKGQRPSYPSSKTRINWDKLEAQVKKEEKEEKLDGDAALNKFFKDIYSDADEDMRRAMSKSFVESNGTVLSTNWKDVGKKKVESTPPDNMELKKWEY